MKDQYNSHIENILFSSNKKTIISCLENYQIISKSVLAEKISALQDIADVSWITIDKYHHLLKKAFISFGYSPNDFFLKRFHYNHLEYIVEALHEYFVFLADDSVIKLNSSIKKKFNAGDIKNNVSPIYTAKDRNLFITAVGLDCIKLPFGLTVLHDFNDNDKRMLDIKVVRSVIYKKHFTIKEESFRSHSSVRSYLSDYNSKAFDVIKNDKMNVLESMSLKNINNGTSFSMKDLALKSEQNHLNELQFKVNCVEEEAVLRDFKFLFITITLPTEYHSNKSIFNHGVKIRTIKNKKFKHNTKKGHSDLNDYWNDVRKYFSKNGVKLRAGVDYYYITVNEAHSDGCEHRHIMFFCKPEHHDFITDICKRVYKNKFYPKFKTVESCFDKHEHALEFVREGLDKNGNKLPKSGIAKPSTYLTKYIFKEIKEINEKLKLEKNEEKSSQKYNAVKKWARLNSIRQINIGGMTEINFQAWKIINTAFNSQNTPYHVRDILKNSNVKDSSLLDGILEIEKILFVPKVLENFELVSIPKNIKYLKTNKMKANALHRYKVSNYNKIKTITNKFNPRVFYIDSVNKYDEKTKKISHISLSINNNYIRINLDNYYTISSQ